MFHNIKNGSFQVKLLWNAFSGNKNTWLFPPAVGYLWQMALDKKILQGLYKIN